MYEFHQTTIFSLDTPEECLACRAIKAAMETEVHTHWINIILANGIIVRHFEAPGIDNVGYYYRFRKLWWLMPAIQQSCLILIGQLQQT
jgi:hypothetical protein